MAFKASRFGEAYRRFKPHLLIVLVQIGYTFLYFITEASFNHGMNPHVFVTYRHIVAGLALFPFAFFLERISLTMNMYLASLRYTSPTFITSMLNTIAALTFVIAVVFRLEVVDVTNPRGIAKIVGTLVSLAAVMTMTLYKGPAARNISAALINIGNGSIHENWLKGPILTVASCITWSGWYIMQAFTLKRYPAQLSLTTWLCLIGGAQSAVFTVFVEHKPRAWIIGFNVDFWAILYAGVVCSGLLIFIQLWCTEQRGPVFVTMFNPLGTIMVAFVAYFVIGEKLYLGRVLGGVTVIIGLYLILWGKEGDQKFSKKAQELSSLTCEKEDKEHNIQAASADISKEFLDV
ncbi:PREDICTED: WAT1-related protein At1g44800-like isoform X2 [Nelumbo nucifera]|uniref:WAT1-related protein n=1 Tax=Nelumbo nucifera TaxID=4432 RepID=A0A1U8A6Z1_NELNU|nr:PREDICTED: WAT1-related protein At1g44800-like isoform X2 [Nelumbo nucifera]